VVAELSALARTSLYVISKEAENITLSVAKTGGYRVFFSEERKKERLSTFILPCKLFPNLPCITKLT
jgi:hypothetical protein